MKKSEWAGAASTALVALTAAGLAGSARADTASIAAAIKGDEATLVQYFNACDMMKGVSYDAPNFVGMFHGAPNTVGAASDMAEAKKGCQDKTQHVVVANETVDVAASGEMAVYRSTYVFTGTDAKTKKPMTEKGNYLTGWRKQPDGSWRVEWSIVSNTP
jgi:ketosteroid isomerase-like protein